VRVRTVLDARPSAPPRYLLHVLVLAHSWAVWSRQAALEVVTVGRPPAPVEAALRDLGVGLIVSEPHPLDGLTRTANKLLALAPPDGDGGEGVLVVDNDVCLLGDVGAPPRSSVGASVASRARVRAKQWEELERLTGLAPIREEWLSPHEALRARVEGGSPRRDTGLYLNSGVVWVQEPVAFERVWADHIRRIDAAFRGHLLESSWVSGWGGDQAGLATAVAEHGGFAVLPVAYNFRPVCFRLGADVPPKIVHLGELGTSSGGMQPFSELLTAWWRRRILGPIRRLRRNAGGWPSTEEEARLLDEATAVRDRLLALGRDARLDRLPPILGPRD
jgi:hypothetical protein